MIRRALDRLIGFSGRRPWRVLLSGLGFAALCWLGASRLELRTDLLELLPRDSPGFIAFERQLKKLGGGATLLVLAESPGRDKNRHFIDTLAERLERRLAEDAACRARCRGSGCAHCGERLIARVEAGTREVQGFLRQHRWLYASLAELEDADERVAEAIAKQSGLVEDLESDESVSDSPSSATDPRGAVAAAKDGPLERFVEDTRARLASAEARLDPAPTGYFETAGGDIVGLRIVANSTPLGDVAGDRLLAQVRAVVSQVPAQGIRVGYAGDIPNSLAERQALASAALLSTLAALALVLLGIAAYFRSLGALVIVGLPALVGVGGAYAFAAALYGYVNSIGAFLGAIILGNGINYPIVLLSRYEEFRAAGQTPEAARSTAVWNAFRAELVGAAVASVAYGSLAVTRFRGFSQFGAIGCVGMLLVWCATILLVPALLAILERARSRAGGWRVHTRAAGPIARFVAAQSGRWRWPILAAALLAAAYSSLTLPRFLRDPWEYDFDRLGSRASKHGGAGSWSLKAERVFGGKRNVAGAMMIAESAEQASSIKRALLDKDAHSGQGRLIAEVAVLADVLPGSLGEQRQKVALIERIEHRLTPRVRRELSGAQRRELERLLPEPAPQPIGAEDLPEQLAAPFRDRSGRLGTVFYVRYRDDVVLSNGRTLLRIAALTDDVELPGGVRVQTASRATIFAEMIRSLRRDVPLASALAFAAVLAVVLLATHDRVGALAVVTSLVWGVSGMLAVSSSFGGRLNFVNFIAIPITLGIGCEYPFNVYDRSRLLGGDVPGAVERAGMAVALCSYTTIVGYGSLLFADSQALQSFGRMAIVGEFLCSVAALFVMPALLGAIAALRARRRSVANANRP